MIAAITVAGVGLLGVSSALAHSTSQTSGDTKHAVSLAKEGFGKGRGEHKIMLSTEEQARVNAMSETEKHSYFAAKHEEMHAKRQAYEAVIDKLLAGNALTAEEETLRAEIITERAKHKEQRATMEAERTKMKAIFEKKQKGETLTTEEQELLTERSHHKGASSREYRSR